MGGVVNAVLGALRGAPNKKVRRVATPNGVVERDTTSLMQQRGWRENGRGFVGPYATHYGTWDGRLEPAGDRLRVFIKNPPVGCLVKHPRFVCFHETSNGWWSINLHTEPIDGDLNSVVAYVERVLTEAIRMK